MDKLIGAGSTQLGSPFLKNVLDKVDAALEGVGPEYRCWLAVARSADFPDVALRAIADSCRTILIMEDLTERDERFFQLAEVVVVAEEAAQQIVEARCKP